MTAQDAREAFVALLQLPFDTTTCTSLRIQVAEARVDALSVLYNNRAQSLVPKDAQWTELDRKTMLDGFTAEKEREYQLLLALEDILSDYLRANCRLL